MRKILDHSFESTSNYLKYAPAVIERLSLHKNKERIQEAIHLCREYLTGTNKPPVEKICAAKFIKDLVDEALIYVLELVQNVILPVFKEIILYRSDVNSIKRGSTYLLSQVEQPLRGNDMVLMMSTFVNPSKTYFQLVHECVFFWAQYFDEENSPFKMAYQEVQHCAFPSTFKHFKDTDVKAFKEKYRLELNAVEYELDDCFKKWEETKLRLAQMTKTEFRIENLDDIYQWIVKFVTEYTNLLVDLQTSFYYKRKGLKERMLELLVEEKEFVKVYVQCLNKNSFFELYRRYGKYEQEPTLEVEPEPEPQHDTQEKTPKKKKVKKAGGMYIDPRVLDIEKIYLADYPELISKFDISPIYVQRYKHFAQYKKLREVNKSGLELPRINQNHPSQPEEPLRTFNNDEGEVYMKSQKLATSMVSNDVDKKEINKMFSMKEMETVDCEVVSGLNNELRSSLKMPEIANIKKSILNEQDMVGTRELNKKIHLSVNNLAKKEKLTHSAAKSVAKRYNYKKTYS